MTKHLIPLRSGLVCMSLLSLCATAQAQIIPGRGVQNVDVQKLANAVLGIMSYTVAPDVTTSSLSINNATGDSNDLMLTQLGGGFTLSRETPLYLEGNAAYARYDPVFLASDGVTTRSVPVKWNSVSVTVSVGWDFTVAPNWVVRPMVTGTYGEVASDLNVGKWWIENNTNADIAFLDDGKLKAYGVGGALMLDYEKFSTEHDDDLEVRYTNVDLRSTGNSAMGVEGYAKAESLSVWARRRIPTGWWALERPVRYVFEGAYTRFLGNEDETGLTQMSSIGFGFELDTSRNTPLWVTRARLVGRYKFGPGLKGYSVGMAVSF